MYSIQVTSTYISYMAVSNSMYFYSFFTLEKICSPFESYEADHDDDGAQDKRHAADGNHSNLCK